jgi:diguanylate cyclase (GGDEF)-like protein
MEFFAARTLKSVFVPGGIILFGAILLLDQKWVPLSPYGITFFYYTVFIAAALLAWRFHSTRILFSAFVLLLAHYAIQYVTQRFGAPIGFVAFEAVVLLVPLDFIFLTFFPERGSEGRTLMWFIALLFFESVFVGVLARPEQPAPAFLHFSLIRSYHAHVPQPAMLAFIVSLGLLVARMLRFHKATDSGMFWALVGVWLGFQAGAIGKVGTAYFGAAALALAGSIIENSYSLAYQDELTGLHSRRSFNDATFRLKAPYAIAVVDIDHFKNVNDTYGHDTGDQVLRLVASKLARVGGGGEAFRVGGEEFTVLFPNRSASAVMDYLDLLRLNIENSSFRVRSGQERRKVSRNPDRRATKKRVSPAPAKSSVSLSVTVSIGLAESQPRLRVEEVIDQADQALYRAKRGGRNRIEAALVQRKNARQSRAKRSAQL